jgi:predicted amidohydrolase
MKVASVEWKTSEWKKINAPIILIKKIKEYVEKAMKEKVDIIVFPGFTGCFFQQLCYPDRNIQNLLEIADSGEYIEQIKELSKSYKITICPGSYWQRKKNNIYHESGLIQNGEILLKQRQIYLARWERELGFSRGASTGLTEFKNWQLGIIISTDVFYPQVSRIIALKGADIVLSPVGFTGGKNLNLQINGMWQETQQNQFFTVESGFNGFLGEKVFWGESVIHAPLEMTEKEDGYLDRSREQKNLLIVDLDNKKRKKTISKYNVLNQLNYQFYRKMKIFNADG